MAPPTYKTIEPHGDFNFAVYQHDEYPRGSVLEGSPRRTFLDGFETLKEAEQEHPDAEILEGSTKIVWNIPDTAPGWFDEADAGERWSDDY